MKYTDEEMQRLPFTPRMKQVIDYSGMRFYNSTPMDIDGFIEKNNRAFVFYEYKLKGTPLAEGQQYAYVHLVDSLQAAGKKAVLFVCEHKAYDPTETVTAKTAMVTKYYCGKKWFNGVGKNAKDMTDAFFQYCENCKGWER